MNTYVMAVIKGRWLEERKESFETMPRHMKYSCVSGTNPVVRRRLSKLPNDSNPKILLLTKFQNSHRKPRRSRKPYVGSGAFIRLRRCGGSALGITAL